MSSEEAVQEGIESRWPALVPLFPTARRLVLVLLGIAALDVGLSLGLSVVVPEPVFLRWYLDDSEPRVIERFLAGEAELLPDAAAGWRNRPNVSDGNWVIDEHGSRSHRAVAREQERETRILFLGSSVINGGTRVTNDESISAYLEDPGVETLNFGTMLYSVDQALLAYRSRLADYGPQILVVGVHSDVEALSNVYVPFRNRAERFMPFVKPVLAADAKELRVVGAVPQELLADAAGKQQLLDLTREEDSSWFYFETYKRLGVLPVASALRWGLIKLHQLSLLLDPDPEDTRRQLAIMTALVEEAEARGARVLFLKFPRLEEFGGGVTARIVAQASARHDAALQASGLDVLSLRDIIADTGRSAADFYGVDGVHTTAEGNRLIAEAIRERLGLGAASASN